MDKMIPLETNEGHWKSLYKIAGIAAIAIALLLLGEVYVYSIIPNPSTTIGYMELFLKNPLFGLLHFDLLGMISYLLFIPFTLSLYRVLKEKNESVTLIATVLFFVGIVVFFSTNTTFPMLSLSKQYALAGTDTERAMLLASFQTMVTLFKIQAFMLSYIIVSIAWLMIGFVMLQSKNFNKFTSIMGILTGASGIIAELVENTARALLGVAIAFYFAAIVFLFIWVLLTGRKLLYIGANLHKSNNTNKI
ncbi:MAG: DUF4386 domain-containing protein [Paludibacteraceae bacterium]